MTPSQTTRPGFMLYFADWLLPCHILTDEQLGAITRAAIEYAQHGTIAHMDDMLSNAVLTSLLPKLDADARRYDETIAKRSMAGKISAAKRASPQFQHMFTPVDARQPKPEPNSKTKPISEPIRTPTTIPGTNQYPNYDAPPPEPPYNEADTNELPF